MSLSVRLRVPERDLEVDVDLPVGPTGIFGPSGSGKTTLLHALAGLVPAKGSVVVDGRTWLGPGVDLPPHARRLGMVFQDLRLFPHMTVRQDLAYGAVGPLDPVVEALALGPLLDRPTGALSGGERQRVAVGRALLRQPDLLLLDEPLSALDEGLKRRILPMIRQVVAERAIPVLYVSHQLTELLQLTGELLVLEKGRVLGCGPFDALLGVPAVLDLAHRLGLDNVLTVRELRRSGGLVLGTCAGVPLRLPPDLDEDAMTRGEVRVALRPEDVLLAVGDPGRTSARNALPGRVIRLLAVSGRELAELDVGFTLRAEITRDAATALGLGPGAPVTCLVKTTALRPVG